MTLKDFLVYFEYSVSAGNGYNVPCPAHTDKKPSLSVTDGEKGLVLKCHAGCSVNDICRELGVQVSDLFNQPKNENKKTYNAKNWKVIAVYPYHRQDGSWAYEIRRTANKDFLYFRKNDVGEWICGHSAGEYWFHSNQNTWFQIKASSKLSDSTLRRTYPEGEKLLYRLPELIAAPLNHPIIIVEGEKDVDRCRANGFVATCNPLGAGNNKWLDRFSQHFDHRRVVIIPDNDPPPSLDPVTGRTIQGFQGQQHAKRILDSLAFESALSKTPIEAKILELQDLPLKGDVSDWFDAGHTAPELQALIDAAFQSQSAPLSILPLPVSSSPAVQQLPPQKPVIDVSIDDMPKLNAQCWQAIEQMNNPPILFTYGSALVRTRFDWQDNSIILDTVTPDVLRHELSQMADWRKANNVITKPPSFLVKDVLASRSIPLFRLNRIVTVPVFAPDGTLLTTPGYNKASGVIYAPPKGYQSLPVPDVVTQNDVEEAKDLIDELLRDFPFSKAAGNADYCNAVSLFLLPFVRDMIDGPTPLHLIEASMPGSGKGLLASSLLYPGLGKIAGAPQPRDDDELRKFITSELIAMRSAIFLDNISRTIDSGAFAAALTLETWNDRVLGTSATANVKIRSLWLATANNATLSTEITRRTVRIRLTPDTDRPEERAGFLHEDQTEWVVENRPRLVRAAHVICKWAIQQGMPKPKRRPVGSFERWSRVMSSIMECAGYKDFLANYRALQDGSDTERIALSLFAISAYEWMQKQKKDVATNGELLAIAMPIDGLEFCGKDDHAREMSFGRWIKSKNEVITEYSTDDDDPIEIYRLKILSGIAGKSTNRGKSVTRIELIETVNRR